MSLPKFEVKGSLFESLGSIAADLFDEKDKYSTSAGGLPKGSGGMLRARKASQGDGLVVRNLVSSAILASISLVIFLNSHIYLTSSGVICRQTKFKMGVRES
jgi:hypothetical protein